MRLHRLNVVLLASAFGLTACRDSGRQSDAAAGEGGRATQTGAPGLAWFPGAAPLLLAPGRSPDRTMLVLADSTASDAETALRDSSATLLRLDGTTEHATVALTESAEGCIEAAIDPSPATAWGVGFVGGTPEPIRADTLSGMSTRDSLALTHTAYRLASTLPAGQSSRFNGLPFTIVELWRLRLPDGRTTIVASLRRQINQEDSPLAERTFIVADADSSETDGYALRYSERSSGDEETIESRELLGAVRFAGADALDLVISHDFGDETSYSIVERTASTPWHLRWASRRFSC